MKRMSVFTTPILFLIFNRPDTTKQVFQTIRKIKPERLYVAADGPRNNDANEVTLCQETRAIINKVDWQCEIKTLFRDSNLGCRKAVSSAIDWFFENEEMGIILEDDCLPNQSFFLFCNELLIKFRYDKRVMMIGGVNFISDKTEHFQHSYFFSKYTLIWGWATWRRAWQYYDVNMDAWEKMRKNSNREALLNQLNSSSHWHKIFDLVYKNKINTWDYQWTFACWSQNGLSIIPKVNLVSNIGFDKNSTHTNKKDKRVNMERYETSFPLTHPNVMFSNSIADEYLNKKFIHVTILQKIISKLKKIKIFNDLV